MQPLKTATLRFSATKTPLVADIVVAHDVLDRHYTTLSLQTNADIQSGAKRALQVLSKYYSISDDNALLRLAVCRYFFRFYLTTTVFHPRLKTEYLVLRKWQDSWISTAKKYLQDIYTKHYRTSPSTVTEPVLNELPPGDDDEVSDILLPLTLQPIFTEMTAHVRGTERNPVALWLAEKPVNFKVDALNFWMDRWNRGDFLDGLTRMAIDILSIPATSVDVERLFSQGGLTVSSNRHR